MKLYERRDRHFQVLTFQEAKGMMGISYLKLNEKVSSCDRPLLKHRT
jgi:ankyrin repeat domain-containing protein 50